MTNLLKITIDPLNLFKPYSNFQANCMKMGGRTIEIGFEYE